MTIVSGAAGAYVCRGAKGGFRQDEEVLGRETKGEFEVDGNILESPQAHAHLPRYSPTNHCLLRLRRHLSEICIQISDKNHAHARDRAERRNHPELEHECSVSRPLLARDELGTGTLFHPHGGRLGCVMNDDGQDMATR